MLRHTLLSACCLVLLLALPACDGDDDDGSFRGTLVLPDRSVSLVGDAYYTVERDGAESTFVLFLTPDDLEDFDDPEFENLIAVVFRRDGDRPDPGVYPIFEPEANGSLVAFYLEAPSQRATVTMIAESGSLTVDEIDDGDVEGSFTFAGELLDPALPNGRVTASVNGTFEATRVLASELPGLADSFPNP
jgi:hypothetical protein